MDFKKYISEISDFPKKWISFKDMSPILEDSKALEFVINSFELQVWNPTKIVGLDARGFIFGSILAYKMKIPFVMLRKAGKLPWECESVSYDLEYGSNTFEIQKTSINTWDKIAIVDDILNSRVASSNLELLPRFGIKPILIAPKEFHVTSKFKTVKNIKSVIDELDMIMSLRVQHERHNFSRTETELEESKRKYAKKYCITKKLLKDRDLLIYIQDQ